MLERESSVASYNVSGEYSLIRAAGMNGWVDEAIILEVLTSIRRAGSDIAITYFAEQAAGLLGKER